MKPLYIFHTEQNKGGIYYDKANAKWKAWQHIEGKRVSLGHFKTEREAVLEFNRKQIEVFGRDARLKHVEKLQANG